MLSKSQLANTKDILFLLSSQPVAECLLSQLEPKDIFNFQLSSKKICVKVNSYFQMLPKVNATIKKKLAAHQIALAKKNVSFYRQFDNNSTESKDIHIDMHSITPTREEKNTVKNSRLIHTLCSALLPQAIFMGITLSLQEKLPGSFEEKMIGIGCISFSIGCMTFLCLQARKICKVNRAFRRATLFMEEAQDSLLQAEKLENKAVKNEGIQ